MITMNEMSIHDLVRIEGISDDEFFNILQKREIDIEKLWQEFNNIKKSDLAAINDDEFTSIMNCHSNDN